MVTTHRHGMRCGCGPPPTATESCSREASACGSTPAPTPITAPASAPPRGDAAPGPYRWEAVHVDASCVYEHLPRRLLPRLRRRSPTGDRRAAGRRDRTPRRTSTRSDRRRNLRPGEEPGASPTAAASRSMPTWSVTSRRPQRRSDGASRRGRLGRARARRPGCGASARSRAPTCASRPTAASRSSTSRTTEMGQGARTVMAQIAAAQELAIDVDGVTVQGADTLYPYDRSTPAPAARHPRRPCRAARRRPARAPARERRRRLGHRARRVGGVADEGRPRRRPRSRPRADRQLRRIGGELVGEGEVRPEQGSGSTPRDRSSGRSASPPPSRRRPGPARSASSGWRRCRRRRQGDQPAAGRAPGRGRGPAGRGQRAVRGDGLRGRRAHERHPARLPRAEDGGHAHADRRDHRRERRRPSPYGAKGCGEGAQAATPAAIATALADAGVPMYDLFTPSGCGGELKEIKEARSE